MFYIYNFELVFFILAVSVNYSLIKPSYNLHEYNTKCGSIANLVIPRTHYQ